MSHEVSSFDMSWIDESIIFIIDMVEIDGTCCIMGSSSSPLSAPRGRRSTTQLAALPHWPFQSAMDIPRVRHPWVSTSTRTSCPSKRSGRRRYLNGIHGVCVYIYMAVYTHTLLYCIYRYQHIWLSIYIYIMYIHEYMWDSLPEAFPNPTLSQQKWEPFCQFAARSDAEIGTW